MIQSLNLFLISHDSPTLLPGSGLSWGELEHITSVGAALIWDYRGDLALLPATTLLDAQHLRTAYFDLLRIGRNLEAPAVQPFTRDQTVPLSSAAIMVTANDIAPPRTSSPPR